MCYMFQTNSDSWFDEAWLACQTSEWKVHEGELNYVNYVSLAMVQLEMLLSNKGEWLGFIRFNHHKTNSVL